MTSHDHDELIELLVADAPPVRRVPPLRVGLAGVALLWLGLVGSLAAASSLRGDLASALAQPAYGAVFVGLLVAGLAGALAGLSAAVPGRERLSVGGERVCLAALVLAAAVCLFGLVASRPASAGVPMTRDLSCFLHAAMFSVVPAAGLLAYVLRGWVAQPMRAAAAALLGAAAFGGCAVHLACGLEGARHVLLGHTSAPVILTAALVVPLAMLLRRHAR